MVEQNIMTTLTVLAIGLVFGFLIGMLYYNIEIQKLKKFIKINLNKT